jgi:DNA-binding response OmpR family regulator
MTTRILVVDDEPQILRALRINLTARQYHVLTAANGAAALHEVKSNRPDLVVLDLGLPDIDGVEVIRRLRTWTQVPIVVLSGRVDSHDKVEALDAGADDYVTKPFSVDELLPRVRAVTAAAPNPDPRPPSRSAASPWTSPTTPSRPPPTQPNRSTSLGSSGSSSRRFSAARASLLGSVSCSRRSGDTAMSTKPTTYVST